MFKWLETNVSAKKSCTNQKMQLEEVSKISQPVENFYAPMTYQGHTHLQTHPPPPTNPPIDD